MENMLFPKQPYYLKGYSGHCPEMNARFGSSYSALSHKILLDPLVRHSHKLVLSDTVAADFQLKGEKKKCQGKEGEEEEDDEQGEQSGDKPAKICERNDMQYKDKFKFPISPGYTGHLPATYDALGVSKTAKAQETIPHVKERLSKANEVRQEIEKISDWRYGRRDVKTIEDKQLLQDEFALPLIAVRPEYCALIRNVFQDEAPRPTINAVKKLPYFMEALDEGKYFVSGYTGHVPFGFAKFGESHKDASNCALKDFTYKFNSLKSTEWAPAGTLREEPTQLVVPHSIYSEKHGLLPNYTGFVPGLQFRNGKRFGELSRDAKKYVRGDLV